MTNRYDVQIMKNGEWMWAAVVPCPTSRTAARLNMAKMKTEPFWIDYVKAEDFRVFQTGFTTKGIR